MVRIPKATKTTRRILHTMILKTMNREMKMTVNYHFKFE